MWPDRAQNLLVLRSLQLSCRREVRVSLYRSYLHECHVPDVKEKDRRPYLSQNIGSAVAGSAGSVPPPLPKKCTSDFTTRISLFNKYECIYGMMYANTTMLAFRLAPITVNGVGPSPQMKIILYKSSNQMKVAYKEALFFVRR